MATKLGIDLPPDLLEAARITQAANRNKLSIRDQQNRVGKKIAKAVDIIKKDVIDPRKGGVPEYENKLLLPKYNQMFSWVAVESNMSFDSQTFFRNEAAPTSYHSSQFRCDNRLSVGKKRWPSDVSFRVIKPNNHDISKFFAAPGLWDIPYFGRQYTWFDIDSLYLSQNKGDCLNFDVKKDGRLNALEISIIGSQKFTCTNQFLSNSGTLYLDKRIEYQQKLLDLYLYLKASQGSDMYLYVTWKTTGSFLSETYLASNNQLLAKKEGSTCNLLGSGYFNLAATTDLTVLDGGEYYTGNLQHETSVFNPNRFNVIQINSTELPLKLRGIKTLIYKIPQQSELLYPFLLSLSFTHLINYPPDPQQQISPAFAAGLSPDDFFLYYLHREDGTSQSCAITLNERILITVSGVNYANI